MAKDKRHYDASDIQVLEGLDPVRKRPGMYIGSTGARGLHHLVYEVVDNSIDEALAGICDHIIVKINKDGSVEISDNGSGIPVATHPQTGKSTVETVLTILHAGGKFDNSAYKVSGGLHGVGVSVVNALSNKLVATIKRDGKIYRQEFARGKRKSELNVIGKTKKEDTGTTIYFEPDDTIFETVEFSFDVLSKRFREMAFLNKGIKIEFIDERKNIKEIYHYEGGIKSFVEFINEKKKPIHDEIIYIDEIREETAVEIAIQYTDSYSEVVLAFANNINTEEGGSHLSGFRSALTRTLNDYGRKNNIIKEKEENLSGEDVREGISAVISVKLPDPQFEGQTKAKLGNSETRGIIDSVLSEELSAFLEENPKVGKQILDKALSARRAREAARRARDLTRKKNNIESMTLPGKLSDCQNDDPSRNEIFLVEGNSAGGSAKDGRDSAYQAILPLRGKIMNVEKARLDKMLNSSEIRAMITAFGTGIGEEFDIKKLRYDKIIIMTDADVDGAHIMTLLLTFFFRYMKPLIEEGHVYVAQAPLFGIEKGTKILRYCHNEKELRLAVKEYKDTKINIKRYKGLGEMDPEQLWETTMNPDNRLLLKVNIDDITEADDTFTVLMGTEVEPRREFITENAVYADYIDA
ncbi:MULTISPECIES: DNA topoisomerase (ATP-hydrolyzing) subunit B [Peptoniphilus]|uniref:DNA topoisomerase (ATP-hydrolyzing) subunit B n=1 Tax=Peptoniphilus TaxID=162289 RepID=UPI000289AE21|nr:MULTISPECIES: DNA topoisomerase (ATP-hydrolyzing) subunit B [Peptoniphilus]MBS6610854.1 DNA topoisomerase (ATP-hydrolyzing) subunit B [Peptoniphilus harei]MDU1043130.1 DNA topoisomerase (ATP-hydrolyzing) subunit B [Peptoniphilus rhinitidis]MDU2114863.1 DNA topoisomerase (ATP-hydrolyzing) subunit B [Peptoniphilus lacydonensis]MDU3751701.1 DNA topoisomerase (ATP-hydrolyzing) subunit B [Peptoniphilus rhinitidis]MDU5274496.1 DNA topoisomerase (ATP-hydrolyzing) subunit B [Peptoniphilus lacydonen